MDRINGADFIDLGGGKRGFRDEDLATGTPGTVVTADFLNATQEEILAIIETSGLVPNAADRSQLAKAIQSGRLNYVVGGGSANIITGNLTPAPAAYTVGMVIRLKVATPNTGAATLNLNGLGAKNIVAADGSALVAGDLNGSVSLVYDGTAFVLSTLLAATETNRGVVQLASAAETTAGTNTSKPASVARMATMVQGGGWNFTMAGGTPNALTASLTPAPSALIAGMTIVLFVSTSNTGPATLNLNGLGAKGIYYSDSSPLVAGDLFGKVILIYDGGSWILANNRIGSENARGNVQLASAAETAAGADTYKPASVARTAAAIQGGSWTYASNAGGAANAFTANITPAPSSYTSGLMISVWFNTPNSGPSTLNLNGLGAKGIYNADGSDLVANDLVNGVTLLYVSSAFFIVNKAVASESKRGVAQLATAAETAAGASTSKPASVARIAAAVQSGSWTVANTDGPANAYTASLVPAPAAYTWGMIVSLWFGTSNTGASTLNLNGLGAVPILNGDGLPVVANDLAGNVTLVCAGTAFLLLSTRPAKETNRGIVQLADAATVIAGTDFTKPVSVARVAAAVQSGNWNYAPDIGVVNGLWVNLTPAPNAYYAGLSVTVKVANTNTGAATVNVNGLGAKSIVHKDGTPLQPRELQAGQIAFLTYDGTNFQFDVSYGRLLAIQTFTASNLYKPTPGMAFSLARAVGGGAAGAGANIPASGQVTLGAPGGAGCYAEGLFTAAQIGASQYVTIGAGGASTLAGGGNNGGTTSLGSLLTAPGGVGGLVLINQVPPTINGNGAFSGVPLGANVIGFQGGGGTAAFAVTTAIGIGGVGASGPFGSGGPGTGVNSNGFSGSGFGAGGGGVCVNIGVGGPTRGGEGSPGYMIIQEYSL